MTFRLIMNFIFILSLFAILFAFAMFQGGFSSWFLFYGFLPIFLYHIALLFYPVQKWTIKRQMSHVMIEAGSQVTVQLTVQRKIPFPLYYCIVEEVFPSSLNKQDLRQKKYHYLNQPDSNRVQRAKKNIIFPWFKRKFVVTYGLDHLPRGEHEFNAVRIRTGDVFGLIKKEHTFQTNDCLIVFPGRRRIHMDERAHNFEQGSLISQALQLKNTTIASGIREYMPGDRFSWINWKQTARQNTVMTKEFEQEKSSNTLIVLDSVYHEGFNPLAYEATVELSMSLTAMFKQNATPASLLIISENNTFLPVQRHDKHDMIERYLSKVTPDKNKENRFSFELKEEIENMKNQHLIIILTTHVDEKLISSIKHFKIRKKQVVLLYVQAKANLSQAEQILFHDLARQGIEVSLLTETELTKDTIEVSSL